MQKPGQREVDDAALIARLRGVLRMRGPESIPLPQVLAAADEIWLILEEIDDISNAVVARIRELEKEGT